MTPLILFNYVGFELQNGAAEEMVNPQRDVPVSVLRSGTLGVLLYTVPVLGILLVLPSDKITGLGGFVDAVKETFTVYGGAQGFLFTLTVIGFIFTLMTSGAVWMIGADRVLAVSAYDGSFFPWFGVFNKKLGTPVRCNVLSGVVSTVFMVAAVLMLKSGSAADAFSVVLAMATSTTLLAYLWIFPAALKLRYAEPDVHRAYRVPGRGNLSDVDPRRGRRPLGPARGLGCGVPRHARAAARCRLRLQGHVGCLPTRLPHAHPGHARGHVPGRDRGYVVRQAAFARRTVVVPIEEPGRLG